MSRRGRLGPIVLACALAGGLALCALLVRSPSVDSSPPPAMRLDPSPIKVDGGAGQLFTVDVVIEGVTDLGAFEFDIAFDRDFVRLVDIRLGPFLGSSGRIPSCERVVISPERERFGCTTEGPGPPGQSGSGVVAHLDFVVQGWAFGESVLLLSSCEAANVLGESLVADVCKNSKLTVNLPTPAKDQKLKKVPDLANLFLKRQGVKIPPPRCQDGGDTAVFEERLNLPITSLDPKDPSTLQQLGAFEFEVHYDDEKLCVTLEPGPAAEGMICVIQDDATLPSLENHARIGCVTEGKDVFPDTATEEGRHLASVVVRPDPILYSQLRANQENGVVFQLNDAACEIADLQGHPIPLASCDDADLTVRYLEGDAEPNCRVDVLDTQGMAFRWGVKKGSLLYHERWDLEPSGQTNGDGDVDVKDLQFVYGRFGSTCEAPHPPQPAVNPKGGPTPTPEPTATPTETPIPQVKKLPVAQELLLTTPPQSEQCADSPDAVSFDVRMNDPITSPDPKTPTQLQQLGAFEIEVRFDPVLVCVEIAPGPIPQGEMTCFTDNGALWVLFGCATTPGGPAPSPQPPGVLAVVTVRPQPGVYTLLAPGETRVTQLVNDLCSVSDLLGHPIEAVTYCGGATIAITRP